MKKIINKMKSLQVISAVLICCIMLLGCNSSEDDNNSFDKAYLSDFCRIADKNGVEILEDGKTVSMGGREYRSGIIFGEYCSEDEGSFVTMDLSGKGIKNISFYLGSVHSDDVYYKNEENFYAFVDENSVLEKTVSNHDLPEFCTLNVENAESVRFKTENSSVVIALGELIAWNGDVSIPVDTSSEEANSVKLMQDIVPYYKSGEDSLFCAYSKNGDTVELDENDYTDALRVFFPKLEKWSNDVFAFFNLEGKYETLSFKAGVSIIDESTLENDFSKSVFATICIYADEKLVLEENITTKDVKNYRVTINQCSKLTIVCKSIPDAPDLKVTFVSMFAEK